MKSLRRRRQRQQRRRTMHKFWSEKVYLSLRLSWAKNKSANCTLHLILAKQNIVPLKTCSLKLDNWNNIWLSRIVKLTQSPWISLHIVLKLKDTVLKCNIYGAFIADMWHTFLQRSTVGEEGSIKGSNKNTCISHVLKILLILKTGTIWTILLAV